MNRYIDFLALPCYSSSEMLVEIFSISFLFFSSWFFKGHVHYVANFCINIQEPLCFTNRSFKVLIEIFISVGVCRWYFYLFLLGFRFLVDFFLVWGKHKVSNGWQTLSKVMEFVFFMSTGILEKTITYGLADKLKFCQSRWPLKRIQFVVCNMFHSTNFVTKLSQSISGIYA